MRLWAKIKAGLQQESPLEKSLGRGIERSAALPVKTGNLRAGLLALLKDSDSHRAVLIDTYIPV